MSALDPGKSVGHGGLPIVCIQHKFHETEVKSVTLPDDNVIITCTFHKVLFLTCFYKHFQEAKTTTKNMSIIPCILVPTFRIGKYIFFSFFLCNVSKSYNIFFITALWV